MSPAAEPSPADTLAAPPVHRAPRVQWTEDVDWQVILQRARSAGRPVLIDFYATWCGPCKLLDAMVYNEPAVVTALAEVMTFKVDVDKPRYDALEERFAIERLPTLVWCDAEGRELDRFTGYVSSKEFLVTLGLWQQQRTIESSLLAALQEDPRDPQTLLAMYLRRRDQGRPDDAALYLDRLAGLDGAAERDAAAEGLLMVARMESEAGFPGEALRLAALAGELIPGPGPDLSRDQRKSALQSLGLVADFRLELADTAGTLAAYDRMVELDRGYLPGLVGFARLALAADVRLRDATTCALRAAIRTDKRPDLVSLLAECYHRRGYHQRAVTWVKLAVDQEPGEPRYRQQLERYETRFQLYRRGYSSP